MKRYKKISAFIDGELDAKSAQRVQYWLDTDKKAGAFYRRMLAVDQSLSGIPKAPTTSADLQAVRQAILQSQHVSHVQRLPFSWLRQAWISIPVVAGVVAGLLIGVQFYQMLEKSPPKQGQNLARQYFERDVLPVLPDGSLSEQYVELNSGQE